MCFKEIGVCPDCDTPVDYIGVINKLYNFSCSKCGWEGSNFKTMKIKTEFRDQVKQCHDCGIVEGELHEENCDMEVCPFCGHQVLTCDCRYAELGYDIDNLPEVIFNNGLSDSDYKKWKKILQEKGRIPYILFPNICSKCGVLWPIYINIRPEDLMKYTFIDGKRYLFCRECYIEIKSMIDNGKKEKIIYPDKCYYCGSMNNELKTFMVEKGISKIEPLMRNKPFCSKCYKRIKSLLNID